MMELKHVCVGVVVRLKDTGECLRILSVVPYLLNSVLIEYEDQNGAIQERVLGVFDEPNLELAQAESDSLPANQLHPLLPTMPGDVGARQLKAYEKKDLNQVLSRNGFKLHYDKHGGVSDWAKDGTIYRVFHGPGRTGKIYLLDQTVSPQTHSNRQDASTHEDIVDTPTQELVAADTTIEQPSATGVAEPPLTSAKLTVGMYVRVGMDEQYRLTGDHREFHIGQIKIVDELIDMNTASPMPST